MSSLSHAVQWLWVCSILGQLTLLTALLLGGRFRKLPLFTLFAALNPCQAALLAFLYSHPMIGRSTIMAAAWSSECITLLAQAFATIQILRITLNLFQGIWSLAWRAITAVALFVLSVVALAARSHWSEAKWFIINRGYHLTFATALIAFLLLVRYYSIPVATSYKMILGGLCLNSCTEVLINTVLQGLLKTSFDQYEPVWQFSSMFSFVIVEVIWVAALWQPQEVSGRRGQKPTDSAYQRLSPEINEELRQLNEKLLRLWKLEARPN